MLTPCGECLGAINDNNLSVLCAGVCSKRFHTSCVNISPELFRQFKHVPGLSWKCVNCDRMCFSVDHVGLQGFLERKYDEMLNNLNSVFDDLKNKFLEIAESKLSAEKPNVVEETVKYSDLLKNKTQPAVIVMPKNKVQTAIKTKTDINKNINPVDSQLTIAKVKNVKEGGILVGFSSKEENLRFKKIAREKLAEDYEIKEIKGVQPRIKVVGMTQVYQDDEISDFVEYAVRKNCTAINLNIECSVVKFFPTRKKSNIHQAVLQVDKISYDALMKAGNLFIGYDYCNVFDAVEVLRCYNCNGFHHSSKHCSGKKSCPKCGISEGLDHTYSNCTAVELKCVNCFKSVQENKELLDFKHGAWDLSCPTYRREVEKFKKDLLLNK